MNIQQPANMTALLHAEGRDSIFDAPEPPAETEPAAAATAAAPAAPATSAGPAVRTPRTVRPKAPRPLNPRIQQAAAQSTAKRANRVAAAAKQAGPVRTPMAPKNIEN